MLYKIKKYFRLSRLRVEITPIYVLDALVIKYRKNYDIFVAI